MRGGQLKIGDGGLGVGGGIINIIVNQHSKVCSKEGNKALAKTV
jgi:hypothetical protein